MCTLSHYQARIPCLICTHGQDHLFRLVVLYMIRVIYIIKVVFPLFMQTASAHSWTCMDLYVFATPYRITWDYYFAAREHTLEIKSWEEEAELQYVCFLCVISLLF